MTRNEQISKCREIAKHFSAKNHAIHSNDHYPYNQSDEFLQQNCIEQENMIA